MISANISKSTRKAVYRWDGWRCALCDSTKYIQIHHIVKRSEGGGNHPHNLITLCADCHALAHGLDLRGLADVEKDRRNPFDMEKLTQLARILNLSKEENALMLDLAGKKRNAVAPDLPEYILERDYVSAALRTARDLDAGEEEWNQFVEELRKRKG